jgi:hypothetical protein
MSRRFTFDAMVRLSRRMDQELRRETHEFASPERFPENAEVSNAREDDGTGAHEGNQARNSHKKITLTLNQAMTMANRASIVRLKCCAERCLHSLEQQQPGWIARKRRELLSMRKNRKKSQRS